MLKWNSKFHGKGQIRPILAINYLFIEAARLPTIIEKDAMARVEERKVLVIDLFQSRFMNDKGDNLHHHPMMAMRFEDRGCDIYPKEKPTSSCH